MGQNWMFFFYGICNIFDSYDCQVVHIGQFCGQGNSIFLRMNESTIYTNFLQGYRSINTDIFGYRNPSLSYLVGIAAWFQLELIIFYTPLIILIRSIRTIYYLGTIHHRQNHQFITDCSRVFQIGLYSAITSSLISSIKFWSSFSRSLHYFGKVSIVLINY